MKTMERTPSQPLTTDRGAAPASAAATDAAGAAPTVSADESYRVAASLAHRPGR